MIRLESLDKTFRSSDRTVHVINKLTQTIPDGSFFTLLGPSGCGKTTTLRVIAGLERHDSGSVWFGERLISSPEQGVFTSTSDRDIGMVFQSSAIWPHMDVYHNVAYPLTTRRPRLSAPEIRKRVSDTVELVGLGPLLHSPSTALSGGQQQRVALARALINAPQVLLLDEPLGALDLKLRRQMQLELKRIQTEVSTTFVHVTHDQEEAMTMADTIAVMRHGRVEQLASPVDLYERPATAFVANFLGKSNLLEGRVTGTDGALLLVETHGVALRLPAANRPATTTNDLLVGVRPEKLHMAAAGAQLPASHNKLQATVTDSSFMGVSTQYVVRTAWQQELTVFTQNLGVDGMRARDTAVQLHWDPQHTFAVPRTGALPETEEET